MFKDFFKREDSKYTIKAILKWLWRAWRGNQLQAVLNAMLGLAGVALSLLQVWAVQRAIDVASHTVEGNLICDVVLMGVLI